MKSKYILSFAVAAMLTGSALAAPVDGSTARTVATHFYASRFKQPSTSLSASVVYEAAALSGENGDTPSFYVVNINSEGFVIVAGDDRVLPILAFSDEGAFVPDGMPDNLRYFIDGYTEAIQYAVDSKSAADGSTLREWNELLSESTHDRKDGNVVVEPLLGNNRWNQTKYYNDLCPADATGNSAYGGHAAVGCGALVMGQVMRYWRYPTTGTGSHSYSATGYGTLTANFGATTYRYSAMPDYLSAANHPDSCVQAVATLLYHCGVAVNMRYGADASVANSNNIVSALSTYFGYPATVRYIERSSTTSSAWLNYLKGELDAGAPFMYGGSGNYGGHVWTCDGYRDDDYFHFNWGWGGTQNGYYALTNCSSYGFNSSHAIIIGIRGPELPTDPDEPEVAIGQLSVSDVRLFPNPTDGRLVVCTGTQTVLEVLVTDMCGRELSRRSVGRAEFSVDLSDCSPGTYILRMLTDKGVQTCRVVRR